MKTEADIELLVLAVHFFMSREGEVRERCNRGSNIGKEMQ
jgi:hypothetical protein